MDRFIGLAVSECSIKYDALKSNMDRFIVAITKTRRKELSL